MIRFFFKRKRSKDRDFVFEEIEKEEAKGCSHEAANVLREAVRKKEIPDNEIFFFAENLQYCSNVDELRSRFTVSEKPEEQKKETGRMSPVIGAIYGDVIGSIYEGRKISNIDKAVADPFGAGCRLTDDSILTIATLWQEDKGVPIIYYDRDMYWQDIRRECPYPIAGNPYTAAYKEAARKYPCAGFGSSFISWAGTDNIQPYGSLGNGSAMRVSPVGALNEDLDTVIERAAVSAMATHNHVEGVKGAVVVAVCIWMAKNGYSKKQIFDYMKRHYSYGASTYIFEEFTYEEACRRRMNQVECSYSVPAAVISFFESKDFDDAIRLSACVGYDTDTNACICGSIAGAYYGVPEKDESVVTEAVTKLYGANILYEKAKEGNP